MANAMNMINLTIIGRVVADPVTEMHNNREVTRFRLIVNQGEERTLVFNCSAWNGLGKIAQYLRKGRLVAVTSDDFMQKTWETNDGKKGINNYLTINGITILDKKPAENSAEQEIPQEDLEALF